MHVKCITPYIKKVENTVYDTIRIVDSVREKQRLQESSKIVVTCNDWSSYLLQSHNKRKIRPHYQISPEDHKVPQRMKYPIVESISQLQDYKRTQKPDDAENDL